MRYSFPLFLAVMALTGEVAVPATNAPPAPVRIDYFYVPGCKDCIRIQEHVLPPLNERYGDYYALVEHDIGISSNVVKLIAYHKHLGVTKNESVCMVLDYHDVLNGYETIRTGLFAHLDERMADRSDPDWHMPCPIMTDEAGSAGRAQSPGELMRGRLEGFALAGVLAAGLIDSLNPCAIATLVFFMSVLSLAGGGRRRLALAGGAFVVACYVTYVALGFGVFRFLHLFAGFGALREAVEWGMAALMAGLAAFSFLDAWRYKRGGRERDVSIRLPAALKRRIHALLRRGLETRNLVAGGFGLGVAVTALESVCTGQVYVPTLVLIFKSGVSMGRSLLYLLAYNLMFIVPLAVILVLMHKGLGMPRLLDWSRREAAFGKVLLGLFFLAMAAFMVVL